ncbi:MAG: hypothetical protein RIS44_3203 [Pseudomonadota bacterium]|jgi:hypothetical protein
MKAILVALGFFSFHSASQADEVVICPEYVVLSSATLQLDKLTPGFEAFPRLDRAHLESAGLYSGPPSLRAQLRGEDKPGTLGFWRLHRSDPQTTKVVDPRFLDYWAVCRYAHSSVDVAKKLENSQLTQCSLKEVKSSEPRKRSAPKDKTIRLGFYCE